MPGQDGSGPMGDGPMTGRGQGRCIVENASTIEAAGLGRGGNRLRQGFRVRGCAGRRVRSRARWSR